MTTPILTATQLLIGAAGWFETTADPNAGGGIAAGVGALLIRPSTGANIPTEIYLKLATVAAGWTKQNFIGINIFNVVAFGAKGDGATDDTAAIQAAINACVAAGGGTVYFPPCAVSYRLVKITSGPANRASLLLNNVSDVTFLGDGYSSKLSMIGDSGAGEWYAIYVVGGCRRIKFINLYLDGNGVTNPDPSEQDHGIELGRVGASDLSGGPADIEINGCYFGRFVGDAIRNLGQNASGGNPVNVIENVRVTYCAFDLNNGINGSRSAIEAQRLTRRILLSHCWLTGSHDQEIDFEPTGGLGDGADGPEEWQIISNHVSHSGGTDAITQTGISTPDPAQRNLLHYNTLSGGAVTGLNISQLSAIGNIIDTGNVSASSPISLSRSLSGIKINANICHSTTSVGGRRGINVDEGNSILPVDIEICDNIASNTNTTGGIAIYCDANQSIIDGNMALLANTGAAGNGIAIDIQRTVSATLDQACWNGNMVIGTANALSAGIDFHVSGRVEGNCAGSYNYFRNCRTSVGFTRAGGGDTYSGFHCATANFLTPLNSTGTITPPGDGSGANIEGSGGPGVGWRQTATAGGPEGLIPAPPGSMATDTLGGDAATIFYKETGTSTTGWLRLGGTDITFGAASLSTATASRFLAPGGQDLAVELTAIEPAIAMTRACAVRQLRGRMTIGTGGGNNTFMTRKNGADTLLTFTITNTTAVGSDLVDSVSYVVGDTLSFRTSKDAPPVTPPTNVVMTLEIA